MPADAMMPAVPRKTHIRSVDTNPPGYPSRTLSNRFGADCWFAKRCAAMCALYSEQIASRRLEAETWWVRLIPAEDIDVAQYGSVAASVAWGDGEVKRVPFDPEVLSMSDDESYAATLDWVHGHMLELAKARGWDENVLRDVYQSCSERIGPYRVECGAKWDPTRRFRAVAVYEIDARGDGWTILRVVDRGGTNVAEERFDSPCRPMAARAIGSSVRWGQKEAVVIPWPDKFAPRRQFAGERAVPVPDQ